MDGSLVVASLAAGISLVALALGRYDRWREGKQRHEDLERAEQQRRESLERADQQRREDLERAEQRRQQDLEQSRPGFTVDWNWNVGERGVWIGLNATALPGRPSTSLIEVGFALADEVEMRNPHGGPDPEHAQGYASFPFVKEIIPCEPGRRYPFVLQPLHGLGPFIDAETKLVPYVIDVEGTRHEGPPMAVFRRLLEEGWRPPDELVGLRFMEVAYTSPAERSGEVARFDLASTDPSA